MASTILIFSGHAFRRMLIRGVGAADVRAVLEAGDAIERYPDDVPYPSTLYLGLVGSRPLHVVAAHDDTGGRIIVVTVYEPDPALWDATFRKRKAL